MTYDLFIAHPSYSSWSLRAWLLFDHLGLPVRTVPVDLYRGTKAADLAPVAPARTVPVLRLPEGPVVGDSLAIAETLHERHPEAGIWPADAGARAMARWIAGEMHSGFSALRSACPMVLTHAVEGPPPSPEVAADLARIETLWAMARDAYGSGGGDSPWLFGQWSAADAFYAPVAMRIAGYCLPVGTLGQAYVEAHLGDPAIGRWRAMGAADRVEPAPYSRPGTERPWPGL